MESLQGSQLILVVARREYINRPILISVTALKVFTNRCLLVLTVFGCEMSYRLADIAEIPSEKDNFVKKTLLLSFFGIGALRDGKAVLSFIVKKITEHAAIFLSSADN